MKKITLLTFLIFGLFQFTAAQNTITVDNTPGANAQYSDLQSAINNAGNNDIIYVQPSETSYGDITLNKPLSLIGYGHSDPEIRTFLRDLRLLDGSSGASISGFYFGRYLYVDNNSSLINNLTIENNRIDNALYFYRGAGVANVIIRGNYINQIGSASSTISNNNFMNCMITKNIFKVIYVSNQSNTIKNNIILGSDGATIANYGASSANITVQNNILYASSTSNFNPNSTGVIYENCLTYNDVGSVTPLNGSNNINDVDPLFVAAENAQFDPLLDDYHLKTGSPAIGAGANEENLGIYNNDGLFVFNNYGYTNGVPKVRITSLTSTVNPGGELKVSISTNTN